MISVALKNPPSGAYYWMPVFYVAGEIFSPYDYLRLDEVWGLPIGASGYMDFRAITYHSDKTILATRDLSSVYVKDDHDYAYNWTTDKWEDITTVVGIEFLDSRTVSLEPLVIGIELLDKKIVSLEPLVGIELLDSRVIDLEPIKYEAIIETKELEIMGDQKYPIPVVEEIPQDSKGKIHILMRNTGYHGFVPGCIWEIRDPDNNLFELYSHRAIEKVGPGESHHFYEVFETRTYHTPGDYSIEIWIQDEANVTLAYWSGRLCTVGGVVLPCTPGKTKCIGPNLYECSLGGKWVFVQANAPECVPPPEKKFPWVAAALIGGGAAVAIAAAAKKPKKPGA